MLDARGDRTPNRARPARNPPRPRDPGHDDRCPTLGGEIAERSAGLALDGDVSTAATLSETQGRDRVARGALRPHRDRQPRSSVYSCSSIIPAGESRGADSSEASTGSTTVTTRVRSAGASTRSPAANASVASSEPSVHSIVSDVIRCLRRAIWMPRRRTPGSTRAPTRSGRAPASLARTTTTRSSSGTMVID